MHDRPVITLTTDFGSEDPFAGVMKGVILTINPAAEIIDITHAVRAQDVREAAFTIGMNYRFFPAGSIHVVVVDPGVGSERRPIIVAANHHYFIGPDNGIFTGIYNAADEGIEVTHITADHYFLTSHSPTFQGRDIFAPIAAYLSRGVQVPKFGELITDYRKIDLPAPIVKPDGMLQGEVIHIDRFGNAMTNITRADLEKIGGATRILLREMDAPLKRFYSDAPDGALCSLLNSSGYLEFFVFKGSAASEHQISSGDAVVILPD
jgi:S-adenosylmethionine hydrolase